MTMVVQRTRKLRFEQIPDQVFFTRDQVVPGTPLLHVGRMAPGSVWEVESIVTSDPQPGGGWRQRRVKRIERLGDDLTLVCTRGAGVYHRGERRHMTFGCASYSAIWRLQRPTGS